MCRRTIPHHAQLLCYALAALLCFPCTSKDHVFHISGGRDVYWFSLPAHILFPQRTTQFAYPLDLVILLAVYIAVARNPKEKADGDIDQQGGLGGRAPVISDPGLDRRLTASPGARDASSADTSKVARAALQTHGDLSNPQRLKLHVFAGFVTGLLPFVHVRAGASVSIRCFD